MSPHILQIIPVQAPVKQSAFDLYQTIVESLQDHPLQDGDILAVSSKYAAISQGRIVDLESIVVSEEGAAIAKRYQMNPQLAQLVLQEADHIFGGIQLGFLLTHKDGILSPNAGIDRSNIPSGKAVLFPLDPYATAQAIRRELRTRLGVDIGIVLTDSWLVPGRYGTMGLALASAGFKPVQDERGKLDLFGNAMQVTQRGIADQLCVCAQMVMGERDEATPLAIIRGSGVPILEIETSVDDIAIPWQMCIYVESLTEGALIRQPSR
ncbi:MAG: coenzyme F420-0:L-glutamate ligase [Anaerolineae bacterium]|jgi:coenzyme F420-0:L-glutamate ligase|nr:coenzyme F420-0:L-glutamate ligase [Anaerolineae bacterium]